MKIQKDIVYGKGNNRDLKLDIFRPDFKEHTHTAIILLHGGGWRVGGKSMMTEFGREMANHGFVALAPEYRLLEESSWPAQLMDVKTAIRWTKENADLLKIDTQKVAVQGFSAGGHLALMAAGTPNHPEFSGMNVRSISDAVAAAVAFFPPVEFSVTWPSQPGYSPATSLLGESSNKETARKASPINYVSPRFPPTFLFHGTSDTTVSYFSSKRLFEALSEIGVLVELHLYPGHHHEFARLPSMLPQAQSEIALFLRRTVVDPEKYYRENIELNIFANGQAPY